MIPVIGYYSSWKVYSTCKIEDIDPTLFDILIYAFAGLNTDGTIRILDDWADIQLQGYKKFNELKAKNPGLKTLLAVGGWNEVSMSTWWIAGGYEESYLTLEGSTSEFNKRDGLFTMAVVADVSNADLYDIPALSKYLDHIHVMTYDFHSHAEGRTGVNAPLLSKDNLNVEYCVNAWITKGAKASKLILGLGAYGQSYTLSNSSNHAIGAPSSGPGFPGPLSQAAGTLYYSEIIKFQQQQGWIKEWSEEQQVPYSYHGSQWVGYDDIKSLKLKVNFAKSKGLGGVMVWSLDMDDPRGELGTKFPLIKAIKDGIY